MLLIFPQSRPMRSWMRPALTITDRVDGRDTAFLINKDQTELQEAVNKAIDALTEDGTLSKLTEEFFGEDNFEVAKELGLRD